MGILNRLQLWWNWLTTDPLGFALYLLYFAVSVLLTLILHEIAHGYVAYRCGDPTAKMLGRLSLDPRKHLDPIGTLCLVFLGFGWAKPVPVNPRNFKGNYRRDDFLVSVAGITVNLTLFILSMALAVALNGLLWKPEVIEANGGAREFLSTSGIGYSVLVAGYGKDYSQLMLHPWLMYVQRFLLMFYSMNLGVGPVQSSAHPAAGRLPPVQRPSVQGPLPAEPSGVPDRADRAAGGLLLRPFEQRHQRGVQRGGGRCASTCSS